MYKNKSQRPNKGIFIFLITLFLFSNSVFARTTIINANIDSIKPIYMDYKIEKIVIPCESKISNCWNVSYQQRILKSLQGYRIKLSYKDQFFTTRMRTKPDSKQLKIRVSEDLLRQTSNIVINAAVAY